MESAAEANRLQDPPPREEPEEKAVEVPIGGKASIGILGAKALAEYKAAKLSKAVAKLKEDLERKEAELREKDRNLAQSRKRLKETDLNVGRLTQQYDQFRNQERAKSDKLAMEINTLSATLESRAREMKRLGAELNDKTALLEALKTAVADARTLKVNAEGKVAKLTQQLNQSNAAYVTKLKESESKLTASGLETQQIRQQLEALNQQLQSAGADIGDLKAQAKQAVNEKVYYHEEATKLKMELERRGKETEELRALVVDLSDRLATAQTVAQPPQVASPEQVAPPVQVATPEQPAPPAQVASPDQVAPPARATRPASATEGPEQPSAVDRILQTPLTRESGPRPTNLF